MHSKNDKHLSYNSHAMKIAMFYDARHIVWWWRNHVENICSKLCNKYDCEIDLYTRRIEEEIPLNKNIKWLRIIYCWNKKKFFDPRERIVSIISMARKCFKISKTKKYDIIHAHTYLPLVAWKISSYVLKIPIIATIHWSQLLDIWEKTLWYYIQKVLLTKVKYDYEVCVWSNFLKYKNVNSKIINIWNGVNIEEYRGDKVQHNWFTILFVWRLERTKWVDILIDAIDIVRKIHSNIKVNIVWYWYDEIKYKTYAQKKWLDKIISFVGKKTDKSLLHYYKSSDLMVVPSRAEGFGIIILEAMASWIAVIATKSWWPEDIIQDWVNWVLIPKENAEYLATEIIKFIENNKEVNAMIQQWYNTIINRYSWDKIVDQLFNLYNNIKQWNN